jgi:hypothetical protein
MIVIGADTHKRSHTLVALDATTGMTRGQLTIPASDDGTLEALRFVGELDSERVWAVEDCRHVSGRLERGLVARGDRVVHIIAFSRARTDPATQAYLSRKHTEGKTKAEAIRCLKRHLARRIWRILYATDPAPPTAPEPRARTVAVGAPILMPCTR